MTTAFITGVTGQDGHYLAELLLSKGYEVYGLVRRTSQEKSIPDGITIIEGDVTDTVMMLKAIKAIKPDEIYNLAAMSHVGQSFKIPHVCMDVNVKGLINVLEGARDIKARVYQASTSELFGNQGGVLTEESSFNPVSPYGASKLAAHRMAGIYRHSYGMFVTCGILFNHESPRRGPDFVTQKIVQGVANIRAGKQSKIKLGNINAWRDWGHAKDYVKAMWMMMQSDSPKDYVIATGIARTVKDVLIAAWGLDWESIVEHDRVEIRPWDIDFLVGDATKAEIELGWEPEVTFAELIAEMMEVTSSKLTSYAWTEHGIYHQAY